MPEQTRTLAKYHQTSIARLQQIVHLLQDVQLQNFDASKSQWADDLYNRAMGIMIASAPAPLQTEWHKIESIHLDIQSQRIKALDNPAPRGEELNEEEERMYQEVIGDNPFH